MFRLHVIADDELLGGPEWALITRGATTHAFVRQSGGQAAVRDAVASYRAMRRTLVAA